MQVARRKLLLLVTAALPFSGPYLSPATAQLLGPEIQINSYTTLAQDQPAVAVDASGNFVVVWSDAAQETLLNRGVFGQGFDPAGGPLGSEFQVNGFTTGQQQYPAVAASGTNNFLVVWDSDGQDGLGRSIVGRRFTAGGLPVGSEFVVNTFTTGGQVFPAVATDANGNFVVVWVGQGLTDADGVFGQRFTATGATLGSEFRANAFTTASQQEAAVSADGLGNFVVVWASNSQDGNNFGVFGQRFNPAGVPLGGEFQVNSYTTQQQREPAVAADAAGNFVVTWISYGQDDGSNWGVFAQRFNSTGVKAGSEFRVNSYTTSSQFIPAVAADGLGGFVVMWGGVGPTDSFGLFGRRFNASGGTVGSELQVNAYTTGGQQSPSIARSVTGNFVVTWESSGQDDGSNWGVFGRRMSTNLFQHGFETNPPFWSATTANMCSGFCDGQSSTGCYCDAFCADSGDCCLDACVTCGYCGP